MKTLAMVLTLLFVAQTLRAQSLPESPRPNPPADPGWTRVTTLATGAQIDVRSRDGHRVRCRFAKATDQMLVCDSYSRWSSGDDFHLDRVTIEQVRRNDVRRNFNLAVGGFSIAGFAVGTTISPNSGDKRPRVVNGLLGAGAGFVIGCVAGVPVSLLLPGKLIYRARRASPAATPAH